MGHIFISYSHNDADYAHRLADTLQAEGFDVWIDARIDYGSQWPLEIQKQLDSCDAFILIMTPRAFASEWVQSELQRAKRKLKLILPLLLEGDEPWLSVESTQYYDVRGEKLPDAKFYSALRRVVVPHEGQAVQLPADNVKRSLKPKRSAGPPRVKTETVIAILGIVATLLAAVIPILWSSLSGNRGQSPANDATSTSAADHVTSTLPAAPSNETRGPEATFTIASVIPSQAPDITDSDDFVDSKGVLMRPVAAGEFIMGSDADDALEECKKYRSDCDRSLYEDEEPPHTVSLAAFLIDTYEVTNARYAACVSEGACQQPADTASDTHPSYYDNPEFENFPVIYVDWNQANSYCEWRGARLPTEAEWERAARGPNERTYPWGDNIDETFANYGQQVGDTTPVDSYESGKSPDGVFNMAGNVWEWVADLYSDTYYQGLPASISNPLGPESGLKRVVRGGSWYDTPDLIRTSVRNSFAPTFVDNNFGIRCARSAR